MVKNLTNDSGDAGDAGLIPGLGRSPGAGNGNRLQCSCLENPMGRGAWWATVHGVAKSQKQLSDQHIHFTKRSEEHTRVPSLGIRKGFLEEG